MIHIPFIFVENIQQVDSYNTPSIYISRFKLRNFFKLKEDRIDKISAIKFVLEKE